MGLGSCSGLGDVLLATSSMLMNQYHAKKKSVFKPKHSTGSVLTRGPAPAFGGGGAHALVQCSPDSLGQSRREH